MTADRVVGVDVLLPCPFCGDPAELDELSRGSYQFLVTCNDCAARTDRYSKAEYAIAAWNKRAALANARGAK